MDGNTIYPPCEDSPLSITSNIIGILTFAFAITAALIYRFSLVRKAAAELQFMNRETRMRYEMIRYKVNRILESNDVDKIRDAATQTMETAQELMYLIDNLDPAFFDSTKRATLGFGVKYMIMRDRLKVMSERFNSANSLLNDMIDT
ncbi:hypothetical protein FHL15_008145 [Xylaria flabelliformis]|uniref:Uncharacterized protein n=1 Tax=Xylaria flabelliformis TaxID=2512241 RepID=A0A553HSK5_9PEZI|nr:hypothetical protein FHL15_008145 [Xylaria flabelliformis]